MSDLHAAIRAELDRREDAMEYGNGTLVGDLLDVVLAVLDVHNPCHRMQAMDTGEWLMVDDCRDAPFSVARLLVCTFAVDDRTEERYVPCPTTLAIAEKLGVEVDGDG